MSIPKQMIKEWCETYDEAIETLDYLISSQIPAITILFSSPPNLSSQFITRRCFPKLHKSYKKHESQSGLFALQI